MSSKTKIIVVKLKDILFYATVAVLCIIVLLLLYILFQPKSTPTDSTISVKIESYSENKIPEMKNELMPGVF